MQDNEIIKDVPIGRYLDKNDFSKLKHGRDNNTGFKIGQYLQTPPLLFSRDGHSLFLGDIYRGCSAFLIAGGPSFANVDKSLLDKPGFITAAINNSVKSYRPNLWFCVDDPTHFIKSIWFDPKITKFVPFDHTEKFIFDNEKWEETTIKVGDCPNIFYYRRNENFNAVQYLFEDTVNWGNHTDLGGGRSVMLAALRILFYIGVREVYLLGVDFDMDETKKYHFEQDRTEGSIKNNNSTYKMLIERFELLKPIFEKNEFFIYNCNPDSKLKVFPFVSVEDAVKNSTLLMPKDILNERTAGLYERKVNEKKDQKKNKVKKELDIARKELNDAKERLKIFERDLSKLNISEEETGKTRTLLENDIKDRRKAFRTKEEKKNLVWYGKKKVK